MTRQGQGIDGRLGRVIAILVILVCVVSLGIINRAKLFGWGDADTATPNPELAACLEERVGAVDRMRGEAVINAAQYDLFRGRAEAFCEAQFGELGNPQPDPY
ncbi:MAG: hypothetical protein K8F25_05425 [Fimbriimonadaceae bacterium]|nr:hypothetical protein [Alphaproteobacteria bacterium]